MTEPLFKAMMELFDISANTKADGLKKFCELGNIIIDATYFPVDDIKNSTLCYCYYLQKIIFKTMNPVQQLADKTLQLLQTDLVLS